MQQACRLVVCALVVASLAGTALAFQGTPASSAVSRPTKIGRLRRLPTDDATGLSKLDWRLRSAVTRDTGFRSSGLRLASLPTATDGKVTLEIEASRPRTAAVAVARLGGKVLASFHGSLEAALPSRSLGAVARDPSVRFVQPPAHDYADAVPGEEVQASGAAAVQAAGITGKGVKIAIIDGTFAGLADRQAAGDLPANVVTADFCNGQFSQGDGHGTAVAEIVHEMAPDAQLYLVCEEGIFGLESAETYAKGQGVQIVNYSAEWFNEGRGTDDAGDPVDAVVRDARASGILWVNSAGNDADTHWSGTFVDTTGDGFNEFVPGNEGNFFVAPAGEVFCGFLKWDEWPAATSDFDLALVDASGNILAASQNQQNGTQPPTEDICLQNTSSSDQVLAFAVYGANVKTSPRLDLYTDDTSSLQYQTPVSSVGDPASSPSAFAVGALCWQNNALEFYSSQGPTVDGRIKPDIAGHDSVSTATFGPFTGGCPSGFPGTSASSPEVAGAAALVKQANPSFTADQIAAFLQKNATDVGAPGTDDQTGAGALHLPASLTVADTTPPTAKALASKGVRGHVMKLLSRVSDDSGQVKIRDQVKQNGHVIKTFTTAGFVAASTPSVGYFNWKVPAKLKGTITHCVRGQDKAGNVSAVSCAKVTLRG